MNAVFGKLEVVNAVTDGRGHIAYSLSEPLFCYERDSAEETHKLVEDTIRSYASLFYGVEVTKVGFLLHGHEWKSISTICFQPSAPILEYISTNKSKDIRINWIASAEKIKDNIIANIFLKINS